MSSSFQPALAPSTPHELAFDSRFEYDTLVSDLKIIEHLFKAGNIDEPVKTSTGEIWIFEEKLNQLAPTVKKFRPQLLAEHPPLFYKWCAIHAEGKEYFATASATDQVDLYLFAQELYRELPKAVPVGEAGTPEREKLNNIIRVIVAGLEYLLTIRDFATALSYGYKLLDFAQKAGLGTSSDHDAPLGLLYQYLARALRARGVKEDLQEAIDYFYKSNESYSKIALGRNVPLDEVIYARTRAAVSLAFGGFLFYNAKGDLVRAKDAIRPARLAFLRDTGQICCKLYYHYFELLYASILREEAGELSLITHEAPAQLEVEKNIARAKLVQAYKIIKDCNKALANRPKYFIHVLFNKALVLIYWGPDQYARARKCVERLFVECQSNPRWLANVFVLKSYLERCVGDVDTALADAIKAYDHAGNHLPVKIEALLARGQAQLARNKLTAARADVEKALQLNDGANLKWEALGNLLLVEMALQQNQPTKACEKLLHVGDLMPSIRYGSLINQYRQLSAKLDHVQNDYLITSNTEVLHYKKFEGELQRWLLEKALREDTNVTRVAKRLQVTKKTIYMWLERYKIKP